MKGLKRLCSVEGCGRTHSGKGFCMKHYTRNRRGIPLADREPRRCSVEGCVRPYTSKGFCGAHLARFKKGAPLYSPITPRARHVPGALCTVDGCDRLLKCRGLCKIHYWRYCANTQLDAPVLRQPGQLCSVNGCGKPYLAKGFCSKHYSRMKNGVPLDGPRKKEQRTCNVEGCKRVYYGVGLCSLHHGRARNGVPLDAPPRVLPIATRRPTMDGYVKIKVAADRNRRNFVLEHRFVMERHIGRPLLKHEDVHHINGVRDDNRLENLQLWESSHPSGQRIRDKLKWAKEIIALYDNPLFRNL